VSRVGKDADKSAFRVIDIDDIPVKATRRRAEWIRLVKGIPEGKALVTNQKEIGASATSVATTLRRYIEEGLLPDVYRVRRRREGKTMTIYILNVGKSEEGSKQ